MMEIRPTELKDLPLVMEIYDYARAFMRANGNATQWIDGYPSESFIRQEIEDGHSFVCTDEQGEILGTFCFILGEDPTYLNIYEGAWLNDEPYGVIHRMATSGKRKGVSEACLNWCFEHFENIRVDTHRDQSYAAYSGEIRLSALWHHLCQERDRAHCLSKNTLIVRYLSHAVCS